jgi:Family of unknown function (DUF6152)
MMKRIAGLAPALVTVWLGVPAEAHHSFAMFDMTKTLVLNGTVTEFQWTNPHSWLQVKVPDGKGGSDDWSVELGTVSGLRQAGWKPGTFHAGDKVTVTVHPLRDGKKGASLVSVVLPNGEILTSGRGPQDQPGSQQGN